MRHIPPQTSIYCLINPFTCKVFYVGATRRTLKRRLCGHVSEAKTSIGNGSKNFIILTIIDRGKMPLIQELEVCSGYLAPMYAERFWIYQYKKVFKHPITNIGIDLTRKRKPKPTYAQNRVYW